MDESHRSTPRASKPGGRLRGIVLTGVLAVPALAVLGGADSFQNPYRLKVTEPLEGATLPSGNVRVVAELELRPQTEPPAKNATPTPKPRVEIFVDKQSKGVLADGQSTLVIPDVASGTHTLLVTASDVASGTSIERKEIHFTVLPPQ